MKQNVAYGFKRPPILAFPTLKKPRPISVIIACSLLTGAASFGQVAAQTTSPSALGADVNAKCDDLVSRGDRAQALSWCRRAAEAGFLGAQVHLAYQYFNGDGTKRDFAQAALWARRAADQGDVRAQELLATMYRGGAGVPKDYAQSMSWARKAAAQNSAIGLYTVGLLYGNGWGVAKDYKESLNWHLQAAEQGYDEAQLIVGSYYEMGWGVTRDHAAAQQWLRKAADQGNEKAKEFLKQMQALDKESPEAVPSDFSGLQLLCKAANGDIANLDIPASRADVQYGSSHYHNGTVVSQTDESAIAMVAGRAGQKYETVQYVRVADSRIEFGDTEHTHTLDRYTGVLSVTYHKKFVFDPIHCAVRRKKF
ncbi:sel1 repeat family protein [Bradyrhizobium sp. CCGUVB1N3]|uniref:tetratricopeptide repeat protein n=1 Tax=Bradyrhizobium sp. CCGUVB1N3 TaxID=2949629 RepID=UPI0020B4472C|nr:tetratricopeptide repeat protein [Bradyrhizobium sp. CCGUVB1N3]MCP3477642.1 sel1 repeat family protein [Bradyrhizobium sp. CCGUVB1N3]